MFWIIAGLTVILLIAVNALYVAAEFATASARRSRLQQMAAEGKGLARLMLPIIENPVTIDNYIATCQLGITASSLALGYYGQATFAPYMVPLVGGLSSIGPAASASVVAAIILLVLTTLQVLLGELVPKNIGSRYPEVVAVATVLPLRWSMVLLRPLIWFFNGSGQLILRLCGVDPIAEHAHIHDPDEIRLLVQESGAGGLMDIQERKLLENTLQMRAVTVRQVMTPRTRMLAAPAHQPLAEMLMLLANSPHSRMPVYADSVDHIVGVVHLLDLLCLHQAGGVDVASAIHTTTFVPESLSIDQVLGQMQRERHHVAIVLDEYGGTAGMVAMEDLIEEIFGEIQDEFDKEIPAVQRLDADRVLVQGNVLVPDVNNTLDLNLPTNEMDTVGGLVVSRCGHVPKVGEAVTIGNITLRVEQLEHNSVISVSFPVSEERMGRLADEEEAA